MSGPVPPHEPDCPPVVLDPLAPGDEGVEESVVMAEAVEQPPRLWPTFVTVVLAIGAAVTVSTACLVTAAIFTSGVEVLGDSDRFAQWLREFGTTQIGLVLFVVPSQLVFCLVVLGAAALSREGPADRLGLRRGRFPVWTWPFFLLGTPVVAIITSNVLSRMVPEQSERLQMLDDVFKAHAVGSVALLLLLISVLPGLVEEVLFRGFMQRRLLSRVPAFGAIGITTLFFAAAHMDPMHAVGVFPLGIWLGLVAWRADSIWPAVLGHVGNNGYAVFMTALAARNPNLGDQVPPEATAVVGLMLAAFVASGVLLLTGPTRPARRPPESGPLTT